MASSSRTGDRVILLHSYPPTPCLYPFEKGLRELGHEVIAFGPEGDYGDTEQFRALEPDCHYTPVPPMPSIDELFDLAGGRPDWLMYLYPNGPLLPSGLRDCPVPTVGWLTEEYKCADVDQRLYYYFDLAPTTFRHISDMYKGRGYDNRAFFNFTGSNWLRPDAIPDERDIDVSFVGMTNPIVGRARCIELEKLLRLRGKGFSIVVRSGLFLKDMLNLYARSKIVFQHSGQGENNLTYRVSEAMSAGALVLSRRPAHGTDTGDDSLIEGRHIVYYDDFDEAEGLIRHYTTHEDERRAITDEATRHVEDQYPWVQQIEWFVDELVQGIPQDFLAQRHERLARFGVDTRREHMDYARYFVCGVGHGPTARTVIEAIPDWETDVDARVLHGLACIASGDTPAYSRDISYVNEQGAHPLALYNHAAVLFWQRDAIGRDNALGHIVPILRQFEQLDADEFDGDALEGGGSHAATKRASVEVPQAHFDLPPGRERGRRLYHLYLWCMHVAVATLYRETRQWPQAVSSLQRALALMPDDGHAMADLAYSLTQLGRNDDAMACYEKAVATEPFLDVARLQLGTLLLGADRPHDTVKLMVDTILTDVGQTTTHYEAYQLLTQAYIQAGNLEAAQQAVQTGVAELGRAANTTGSITAEDVSSLQRTFRALSQAIRASMRANEG